MKKLVPVLAVAVVAIAGFVAFKSAGNGGGSSGRALQFVAMSAPEDAVGVAAVSSPATALQTLAERVDPELRQQAVDEIEFDLFDPEAYGEFGLDLNEPAGFVILEADPVVAVVTLGTSGTAEEARDAMEARLTEFEPPEGALMATTINDAPALFVEDEFVVVFDADRASFVFADLPWDTEDPREELSGYASTFIAGEGEAFADANDIAAATDFDGTPMVTAVLSPETLEELLDDLGPMPGWEDMTAVGLAMHGDEESVTFEMRTVLVDGSTYFTPFSGAPSFGDATEQVPGPIEFGLRFRFDPEATFALLQEELSEFDDGYSEMLDQADEATGVDMEEEVIGNLTGEIGVFVQSVPTEATIAATRATAFFGVRDDEAASATIAGLIEEAGDMVQAREVGGSTLYVVPAGPSVAFGVHGGYLWIGADDDAVEAIFNGESERFEDDEANASAADLFDNDHYGAAFVSFSGQFGELVLDELDEGEPEGTEELLQSLRAISYEVSRDGDVMVANARLDWDGSAAADALAQAFSQGFERGMGGDTEVNIVAVEEEATPPAAGGKPNEEPPAPTNGKP